MNPQTPDEWMQQTGQQASKLSDEELKDHVTKSADQDHPKGAEARKHHDFAENDLPWSEAEEYFGIKHHHQQKQVRQPVQSTFYFLIVSSVASAFVWYVKSTLLSPESGKPLKKAAQCQNLQSESADPSWHKM